MEKIIASTRQYSLRIIMILVASISTIFLCVQWLTELITNNKAFGQSLILYLAIISVIIYLILLTKGAKKQAIHPRQWSWFRIQIYISSTIALLVALSGDIATQVASLIIYTALALYNATLYVIYSKNKKRALMQTYHFSNGTVGSADDLLGFKSSAENFNIGINSLTLPVNVVAITGNMGEGKSTFWRHTAEQLNYESNLHTYISLTETNSKQDFSKLFAERWFDTIKERYAFILNSDLTDQSKLYRVLRDGTSGISKIIIDTLNTYNFGLFKTRTQIFDHISEIKNEKYVDTNVSNLFNNLPEIYEEKWFIAIDELERAPIDEVYRLIEVIERFRQVGKNGLPTQIIFVLCFDLNYFLNLKVEKSDSEHLEKIQLVKNFLTSNSVKSIDIYHTIPTPSLNTKIKMMTDKLISSLPDKVSELDNNKPKYNMLNTLFDYEKRRFLPVEYIITDNKQYYSYKDTYDYILLKLASHPVRSSIRIFQQIEFFLNSFNKDGDHIANLNLSTLLAFAYIKITRPELLPFIGKAYFHFDPDLKSFFTTYNGYLKNSMSSISGSEELSINERVTKYTGIDTRQYSTTEMNELIADINVLVPVVGEYLNDGEDPYSNDLVRYQGTLSDPDVLKWFLNYNREEQSQFNKFIQMFRNAATLKYTDFENGDLLKDFSSFTRNRITYEDKTSFTSFRLSLLIFKFMENNKNLVPSKSVNFEQNIIDKLTYEFLFQLQEAATYGLEDDENLFREIAALFNQFMQSQEIKFESKLIVIDAFIDQSGNGLERVRTREDIIEKYFDAGYIFKTFIKLRDDMNFEFNSKNNKSIYNNESNVTYVLYQSWNGLRTDPFLPKLHSIARKGLRSNPEALSMMWNDYPYNSKWNNYKSYLRGRGSFSSYSTPERRGLFVDLSTLVKSTKANSPFKKAHMKSDAELRNKVKFWFDIDKEGLYAKDENKRFVAQDTIGAKIRTLYVNYLKNGKLTQSKKIEKAFGLDSDRILDNR